GRERVDEAGGRGEKRRRGVPVPLSVHRDPRRGPRALLLPHDQTGGVPGVRVPRRVPLARRDARGVLRARAPPAIRRPSGPAEPAGSPGEASPLARVRLPAAARGVAGAVARAPQRRLARGPGGTLPAAGRPRGGP